jgi:hypothetical protein
VNGRDVDQAIAEMLRILTPHAARDWRVPAGSLDWTCWATAAHVAHDLMAYAGQLAAAADSAYLPFDLIVRPEATPRDVLGIVATSGRLLTGAISDADPTTRAWHWGPTDPGGFAALGSTRR